MTDQISNRRNLIIGAALLIVVSFGVRVWYEVRPLPPVSINAGDIEQRAKSEPGNMDAQIAWGISLRQLGRLDDALRVFDDASRLNPNDSRPYDGMALVAMAQKQPDKAESYYRQSIQHNPNDADAWRGLATQLELMNRQAEAVPAYEKLLTIDPNDADALRQLGLLYTEKGDVFRGHKLLEHAVQLNPSDMRTQRYIGENAFLQERYPESRQALETVVAKEPDNPVVLSLLAQIIVKIDPSPKGLEIAEERARRSIALKPTGSAHLALGQIYLARRQYASAIAEFKQAIAIYPDLLVAYVSLSSAYDRSGKSELARKTNSEYQAVLAKQKRVSGNVGYKPMPWN